MKIYSYIDGKNRQQRLVEARRLKRKEPIMATLILFITRILWLKPISWVKAQEMVNELKLTAERGEL